MLLSPEDSEIEVENMKPGIGKMEAFPSIWGHWAGGPGKFIQSFYSFERWLTLLSSIGDSIEDAKWLNDKLREIGL